MRMTFLRGKWMAVCLWVEVETEKSGWIEGKKERRKWTEEMTPWEIL